MYLRQARSTMLQRDLKGRGLVGYLYIQSMMVRAARKAPTVKVIEGMEGAPPQQALH
jgi:hypothetical protein